MNFEEITKILEHQQQCKIINPDDIPQEEKGKFRENICKALAEMEDSETNIINDKELSERLKEIGVSIKDDSGNYYCFSDILQDISNKFKECCN